jgi:hypothetical protein
MKENYQPAAPKPHKILWNIVLVLSASICYAGAILWSIIWRLDILLYIVVGFLISALLGAIIVDIKRSVASAYISMLLGSLIAVVLFLAPHALFSKSSTEFDFAAIALLTILGKMVLIGLIFYFLGAFLGCYLGEKTLD